MKIKNLPLYVFLQVDADGETDLDFSELSGVSWCNERVFETDQRYISYDAVIAILNKIDILTCNAFVKTLKSNAKFKGSTFVNPLDSLKKE